MAPKKTPRTEDETPRTEDETPPAQGSDERVLRGDLDDPVTHREYSEEQHAAVDAGLPLDPTVRPQRSDDAAR